jgi:hypothetical protein
VNDIEGLLIAAGFDGVERVDDIVYARGDGPSAPEFTVTQAGRQTRLAIRYPVRASAAQMLTWMRTNPQGRLTICDGETELSLSVPLDDLAGSLTLWRMLMSAASRAAIQWRRDLRSAQSI